MCDSFFISHLPGALIFSSLLLRFSYFFIYILCKMFHIEICLIVLNQMIIRLVCNQQLQRNNKIALLAESHKNLYKKKRMNQQVKFL